MLLLLSCISRVRLFATPQTAAHQALPSLGSPGKNTGVGCHFLLQCMKVKSESEVAQSCLTLSDPWTGAYQAPPSMGFSRQEYWSGLPLPSPIFYTQYVVKVKIAQSCPTLCDPVDCSLPGSSVQGILQARILSWQLFPSSGDLPNPGTEPRSPTLQADSLPSGPPGKHIVRVLIVRAHVHVVCTCNSVQGNGTPLQHSCLGDPMGRGAWWATVHGVTEGWTRLSN